MTNTPRTKSIARSEIILSERLVATWRDCLLRTVNEAARKPSRSLEHAIERLLPDVEEVWITYNEERQNLRRQLLSSKKLALAYYLGFHLPNVARLQLALSRLPNLTGLKEVLAQSDHLNLFDLGCGTGAMSHAFLDQFEEIVASKCAAHIYDNTGAVLDLARATLNSQFPEVTIHGKRAPLDDLHLPKSDAALRVLMLGYVWNEVSRNQKAERRLMEAFQVSREGSTLVCLVDAAREAEAKRTMLLRNDLVASGYVPLYPCPGATMCPMTTAGRDWCFSEGRWKQPKEFATVEKHLGTARQTFGASAYIFASPTLAARLPHAGPPRVVGRPVRNPRKGPEFDYLVCQGDRLAKKAANSAEQQLRGEALSDS